MKFLAITLIVHGPDPITGQQKSTHQRLRDVIDSAVLAEELGFDGFGVGERHERPFISSSPPVVLSHIAAPTSRIRLFTAVTTLSLLDPVRTAEDYATLDNLADGRLELIIGKGNGTAQRELFAVTPQDQWDRNAESYALFRTIWRDGRITAEPRFRPRCTTPRSGQARCSSRFASGTAARPAVSPSNLLPSMVIRSLRPTKRTTSSHTQNSSIITESAGSPWQRPGRCRRRRRHGRLLRNASLAGRSRDVSAYLCGPACRCPTSRIAAPVRRLRGLRRRSRRC